MRGHVDAESLALCAEGLLSRRRTELVRSHLAGCPECAAAAARLGQVPALLAQVPAPALPPGIAARLDAALSAEAAHRAADDSGTVPDHAAPDHAAPAPVPVLRAARSRPGWRRGPRLRLPVAARVLAAAGVLAAVGGVSYAVAQSSSPASTSSSSAGGSVAAPATTAVPRVHSPASRNGAAAPFGGSAQFTVHHSRTDYRPDTFAAQAATLLKNPAAGLNHPGKGGGLSRQAHTSALAGCVDRVTGPVPAGDLKLVDAARYQGHPATVIVVQASPARPGTVYVAGPRCSSSVSDILAQAPLPASAG